MNLSQLMLESRQRADMVNSTFIGDTELASYINQSAYELWDILTTVYEYYYTEDFSYLLSSGSTIPLPTDFYKTFGVDINLNNYWVTLHQFQWSERNRWANPAFYNWAGKTQIKYHIIGGNIELRPELSAAGFNYRMKYAPRMTPMALGTTASASLADITYTSLTAASSSNAISIQYMAGGTAGSETVAVVGTAIDVTIQNGVSTAAQVYAAFIGSSPAMALVLPTITGTSSNVQAATPATFLSGGLDDGSFDGISGWEEYIIIDAARKMLIKEESDTSALDRDKAGMLVRIKAAAPDRDAGEPPTVSRVRNRGSGYNNGMNDGGWSDF